MIVLQETVSSQEVRFIPRSYAADTIILTNESTGISTTYNVTSSIDGYYLLVDDVFTLKESNFYRMVVKNGSTEVYRDRVFCTNQNISDFSVNNAEYDEYNSNNDYIIYE